MKWLSWNTVDIILTSICNVLEQDGNSKNNKKNNKKSISVYYIQNYAHKCNWIMTNLILYLYNFIAENIWEKNKNTLKIHVYCELVLP